MAVPSVPIPGVGAFAVPGGATVQGAVAVTTSSVKAARLVTVTAAYNGASVSSQVWLIPPVSITPARYLTLSQKLIITATTNVQNASTGKASMTAPSTVTVVNQ